MSRAWPCRGCRGVAAPRLLLGVLAALSVAAVCGAASSSSSNSIYLLNTMYASDTLNAKQANAVWLGIDAALYAANYKTADNRAIEVFEVDPTSGVDMSDIVAVVQAGHTAHPDMLGVIGPYSDAMLSTALNSSVLQALGLMYMAPYTSSGAVRTWNDQVYFTRTGPRTELLAMMNYTLYNLGIRRTAFMYLSGVESGETEYETLVSMLSSMWLLPAALYSVPYSTTSTALDTEAFDAMANTWPQVVIVWGVPGAQTQAFLEAVLTDSRTSSAYIMTCSAVQQLVFNVYYSLATAGKVTPVAGQILSSSTVFSLTYPSTQHIPMFKTQMSAYITSSGKVDVTQWADEAAAVTRYGSATSGSADFFTSHPSTSQLMLVGWLAGSLLMQTLNSPLWTVSTTTYRSGLFDQNTYLVGGDFVLGNYGGPCTVWSNLLGATCSCNQGGRAALLNSLADASWSSSPDAFFMYAATDCYATDVVLTKPMNLMTLFLLDYPMLLETGRQVSTTVSRTIPNLLVGDTPITYSTLNLSGSTSQETLTNEEEAHMVDIIVGPVPHFLNVHNALVVDPIFIRPGLQLPLQNYLFLMPTLEQQMYVLYNGMSSVTAITSISSNVHLVVHGHNSSEVTDITATLSKTAATFNLPEPTTSSVADTATVGSGLRAKSINYVLGLTVADVADICNFLSADTAAIVVVTFADLSMYYTVLLPAFTALPASVQARLVSFNSLPLWSDTSAEAHAASPLLNSFHLMYPDAADHTPLLLRAVETWAFIQAITRDTSGVVNASSLEDEVYTAGTVTILGVSFGPFTWGCEETTAGQSCTYKNYGSQAIAMLSMQRMLDPTVPQISLPYTPSMVYLARVVSGLTAAQRSGVIAGCVIGGVLLISTAVLLVYFCSDRRDNEAAPKDGDEAVTLIFTDIESSTAMWAALPQLMADAIASHHRVIRQLIKKYGCYEVKTVGDSFMIACKKAQSAVTLACEIQRALLKYDWGTTEIDSKYREFELAKADTEEEYEPTTARLSEEEYAALWCGIRVRIGIHTGLSDIRYDEVTKGYDYYGDTSNMAARTEAIANGGQVVATETTWWALTNDQRLEAAHTAMGPQGLRGVPFAVEMYQLNPVAGRKHAALRTEIDAILPDDGASQTASSAADALLSSVGTMTGATAGVALVLSSTFAPYPPVQRVREMQPLLARWNVGAPPRSRQVSEEDYCQGLINRLAIRVTDITMAKQRLNQNGAPPPLNPFAAAVRTASAATFSRRASKAPTSRGDLPSALNEARVRLFGSVAPTLSAGSPRRMASRASQNASSNGVVPFDAEDVLTGGLDDEGRSRSISDSDELVAVPMPVAPRRQTKHGRA